MNPAFTPNPQRQERLAKLRDFVDALIDGRRVSWLEVEQATGIKMDPAGQALIRLTLKRQRRPYLSLVGLGFEVSSAHNGVPIVEAKTRRFVSALAVARETTEQVSGRHINEMTQPNKNKLLHHQAVFSTLELSASLAKKLPAKK